MLFDLLYHCAIQAGGLGFTSILNKLGKMHKVKCPFHFW